MAGWILAIDVGTTSTAAARRVGDRVETIQLQGGPRMPSLAFWREGTGGSGTGRLVLGAEAEELSTLAPWCLERAPKRRLGEEFIQLGDKQLRPVEIIGAILREVQYEAMSLSGGEAPAEVHLTHPARWGEARLEKLRQAARLAGLGEATLVPEPVAAAVHFASERLTEGEHVAVYDLGGGTLDTAVLQRANGSFEVVGRTGGNEELGGEDFDDQVYRYLGDQLPGDAWKRMRTSDELQDRTWGGANRELMRQARRAKERLSRNPQYEFYLPPPVDQELEANVADFERLIAPTLRGTVAELERTILATGLGIPDMKAVYLAGGSSRIPLVSRLIQEQLGTLPEHLDDPKAVIALGAARLDGGATAPLPEKQIATELDVPPREPPPPPPEPTPGRVPPSPPPPDSVQPQTAFDRLMMPRSREVAIALVAISALFFIGSVLPYLNGPIVYFEAPRSVDPNYWTYWKEGPLYIGFSVLTFMLPLLALVATRASKPVRGRLLLIALLAATGSWNLIFILVNRELDSDQAIGSFVITAAAILALVMAAAEVVGEWRAPRSTLDRTRIRLSVSAILLGTALYGAGAALLFSDYVNAYRIYQLLLIALTVLCALAVFKSPITTRRFSLFLLPASMLGWFSFPAYIVSKGIELELADWLYLGASVVALVGLAIGLTASISGGSDVSRSTGNGAVRGVT
jgi:hypothetical protein